MENLDALARLIRQKNAVDAQIASHLGRPAHIGHAGEFIAAQIFDILLHDSATTAGSDGHFRSGPLAGRSVNVKWYGKHEGLLDLALKSPPDLYLVLAGPKAAAISSRGTTRPWVVRHAFLFDARALHALLEARGVKLGTATSVAAAVWDAAEIYPASSNQLLALTAPQTDALSLFE